MVIFQPAAAGTIVAPVMSTGVILTTKSHLEDQVYGVMRPGSGTGNELLQRLFVHVSKKFTFI